MYVILSLVKPVVQAKIRIKKKRAMTPAAFFILNFILILNK